MQPERDMMASRLRQELTPYLQPGERILWSAVPDASRFWLPFLIWIFAFPWTGFTLFWITMASWGVWPEVEKGNWVALGFPAFGLIFLAVGLNLIAKPFLMRADARHSLYAITDRHAVHYTNRKKPIVRIMPLEKTGTVKVSVKPDGWGTLGIDAGTYRDDDGDVRTNRIFIHNVPDIAHVERVLTDARDRLRKPPEPNAT